MIVGNVLHSWDSSTSWNFDFYSRVWPFLRGKTLRYESSDLFYWNGSQDF